MQRSNIFVSGRLTQTMWNEVDKYQENTNTIVTVDTPYNSGQATSEWKEAKNINKICVPVYGIQIPSALKAVFDHPLFVQRFHEAKIPTPQMKFDTFVQAKGAENIKKFCAILNKDGVEGKFSAFLENFASHLEALKKDSIKSMNDWKNFMSFVGYPNGWEKNLFFTDFLKMFGFSHAEAVALLNRPFIKKKDGVEKTVKIQDEFISWVIKTCSCWRYTGCLTDFIVSIFAVMGRTFSNIGEDGKEKVGSQVEEEVMSVLYEFISELGKTHPKFVTFSRHYIDCETDDYYAYLCFSVVNRFFGLQIDVIAQVPNLEKYKYKDDVQKEKYAKVFKFITDLNDAWNFMQFTDEFSTNMDQLLDASVNVFGLQL